MSDESSAALGESPRHNPFWVCLLVFVALAVDAGLRFAKAREQGAQLAVARANQNANLGRASAALAKLPELEGKLEAVTLELIQLGRTNPVAAQLIREFNINWTPGSRTDHSAALPAPLTNPPPTSNPP